MPFVFKSLEKCVAPLGSLNSVVPATRIYLLLGAMIAATCAGPVLAGPYPFNNNGAMRSTSSQDTNVRVVEIAFTVCLLSKPGECKVERQPFDGPLFACSLLGQQAAVQWIASHPKWRLKAYRCTTLDPRRIVRNG